VRVLARWEGAARVGAKPSGLLIKMRRSLSLEGREDKKILCGRLRERGEREYSKTILLFSRGRAGLTK
jgi:hypothetical protein